MKVREISDALLPVPGCVHQAVLQALRETKAVKTKSWRFSISLVAALFILLLLMGAGVATNQWGVLDYLKQGYLVVDKWGVVQLTLLESEKTGEVFVGGLPDEMESMGKLSGRTWSL